MTRWWAGVYEGISSKMMLIKRLQWIGCLLLLAVLPLSALAQSRGMVEGRIQDAETGESLPGVNVYLEEAGWGSASEAGGRFTIPHVRPGDYTLVASLIGYETARLQLTVPEEGRTDVVIDLVPQPVDLGEVLARADRAYSAASSQTVRAFDLITRPTRSAQNLLRLAPGLITAQHAGGGKAEQIFLRGFDAESRLPGEAASVSELHFTPGNPRNLRLGISYLF